jgi:crossover junction endodeoxyribonuclease RuvC
MTLVLGIDPGSRITGFGLVNANGNSLEYIASGCIRTEGEIFPERLQLIFRGICKVIEEHSPQQAAVEQVFMGRNASAALKLGHARGSALVACMHYDMPVSEYSARQVKQALVGKGAAEKLQVQHMVKVLLGINDQLQEDAADALAVAICHINTQSGLIRMASARSFRKGRLRN